MPPELLRAVETKAWLKKALEDLKAAGSLLRSGGEFSGTVSFHAQQAAEKALKAFLVWHDREFRRTHDLAELGQLCAAADSSMENLCRRADDLSAYAWVFRYPGDVQEPSDEDAGQALALAREVYEAVLARLPAEARP